MPVDTKNTFGNLLAETRQAHPIREPLYRQIEDQIESHFKVKARVIAFFTSFTWPVAIENQDADMLEEMLRNTDLDGRELFLILNSGRRRPCGGTDRHNISYLWSGKFYGHCSPRWRSLRQL